MSTDFTIKIPAWESGAPIPARYAFGKPGEDGPFATSDNVNPAVSWANAPEGTKSFAVLCYDPDVPSVGDDVNQEGKTVPADLPRVDFYHWVLVDIPVGVSGVEEGAVSNGVTAGGKPVGPSAFGLVGTNSYTDWFAGDPDMGGRYGNYDGPCPPWNDSIKHHYHFVVFALDVETLALPQSGEFTGPEAAAAIVKHTIAKASHVGTYSMNPAVPA